MSFERIVLVLELDDRELSLMIGFSSSLEGYPSHFLPKLAHLRHSGFVSSHLTCRF